MKNDIRNSTKTTDVRNYIPIVEAKTEIELGKLRR